MHGGERISDLGLVSADSHVNEPRDLWSANLPPSLREQAMRGYEAGDDGGWNLVLDGRHIFQKSMQEEAERDPFFAEALESLTSYMETVGEWSVLQTIPAAN